jgi:hypothetical protein
MLIDLPEILIPGDLRCRRCNRDIDPATRCVMPRWRRGGPTTCAAPLRFSCISSCTRGVLERQAKREGTDWNDPLISAQRVPARVELGK